MRWFAALAALHSLLVPHHHKPVKRHVAAVRHAVPLTDATSVHTRDWDCLRWHESGSSGGYTADTGNGYYGAYQFAPTTWWGLGYSGYANQAPPWEQDQAALRLYNKDGWAPWPESAAKCGL